MTRAKVLTFLLVAIVLLQWLLFAMLFPRLPDQIPFNFPPNQGQLRLEAKPMLFLFPGIATLTAVIMLAIYPWRHKLVNFAGKKQLRGLPAEYSLPVYNHAYHLVLIAGIFVGIFCGYIMVTLSLFALGTIHDVNLWAVYGTIGVMVLYLLYNNFQLWRLARKARQLAEEGEGEEDGPIEPGD
jgi:hypothetical protein